MARCFHDQSRMGKFLSSCFHLVSTSAQCDASIKKDKENFQSEKVFTTICISGNFTGPSPKKEKSHVCSVCKKGYTTAEGRIKHIIQKHQDKVPEMITIREYHQENRSVSCIPLSPHFYKVKLQFIGVNIFSHFCSKT